MVNRPVTCLLFVLLLSAGFASAQQLMIFHQAADTRAPQLQSATVASDGETVTVVLNEAVIADDAAGFTIDPNGGAATLTLSGGSGTDTLTFTSSRTIANIETVTLAYSSTVGDVTDLAGNDLANSGIAVTNNSTQDPTPEDVVAPTYGSSSIATSGTTVTIVFDEAVVVTDANGFTFTPSGGSATLSYASGSGTSSIVFTSSRAIASDETATIAYSSTTGDVEDVAGNDLATFTAQSVTNNSTYDPGDPYSPIPPETFATPYNLPSGGTTYTPTTAAELTSALAAAEGGDVIVLQAGTTYSGNFKLRNWGEGTDWIYIISSDMADLPAEGERAGLSDVSDMPTITTPNTYAAIHSDFGAHHYRIAGVQVTTGTTAPYYAVQFSYGGDFNTNADTDAELVHHITFDRCVVRSTSDAHRLRHGISCSGNYMAVVDSHISNCKDSADAMAIWIWNGGAHYKFVNNYLEASGENFLSGGTDPQIPGAICTDIEFRGNHCFKPLSWKSPSTWGMKNLFELKNSKRHLVTGNIFENNWTDAQDGIAILFTVRNQSGTAPQSVVADVDFENNIIKNVGAGFNISGEDDLHSSDRTHRIRIRNNLITEATQEYRSSPSFIQTATPDRPLLYLTVSHNTFLSAADETGVGNHVHFVLAGTQVDNIICQNNIMVHGSYNTVWERATNATHSHNALAMVATNSRYAWNKANFNSQQPGDFMADPYYSAIEFEDFVGGNYRLDPASPYAAGNASDATDGTDLGADIDELEAATAGTISGVWPPAEVEIVSATINSDGDELTVVLDGAATITNETGWTVEFDNIASRTLDYVSGSGTDTLVFEFDAVAPSTDGRAPVGTVCLVSYDADTGNVAGLADATDQAVTNNSTQIPEPDLPQNVPTAELLANWDDAADHTPANNAALQALLNAWTPGTGGRIALTAGVDYGTINIPWNVQGTAIDPVYFRSTGFASLPTFSTTDSSGRVTTGDEANMATISRTPSQSGHSSLNITPQHWTHTGSNNADTFTSSAGSWATDELVGLIISNRVTGSFGTITANTATTITAVMSVGSRSGSPDDEWDAGDPAVVVGYSQVPQHIRFVGVKFNQYGSYGSDVLAIVSTLTGGFGSHKDVLPHHIGFDRCAWTHDEAMKGVQDALVLSAADAFVVGCNFYNLYGAGNDGSNAIRWYSGSRKLIENNSFECMGAACFVGNSSSLNLDIDDVVYRRNYHHHPTAWDDGLHGNDKSNFETKVCRRLLIAENVFENQSVNSYNQGHAVISLKGEKNRTSHVTVVGNRMTGARTGFTLLVSASSSDVTGESGPNTDMLIEDNYIVAANRGSRFTLSNGGEVMARYRFLNNTFVLGTDPAFYFYSHGSGTTSGNDFVFRDNVVTSGGFWPDGAAEGALCLNYSWGSKYDMTYNIIVGRNINSYDNDTTPTPLGVLAFNNYPANVAAVGFTDSGGGDYSISEASSFKTSSSTGGKPGCDFTTYNPIWDEVDN